MTLRRVFNKEGELIVTEEVEGTPTDPDNSVEVRLAALEARLDKAERAQVTGEAAKLRDALRGG